MRDEDRQALKIFRETIVAQSTPTEALVFYKQVLKGNSVTRKAWAIAKAVDLDALDPSIKVFLASDTVLTKEDFAYIAASEVASEMGRVGFWDKVLFCVTFGKFGAWS